MLRRFFQITAGAIVALSLLLFFRNALSNTIFIALMPVWKTSDASANALSSIPYYFQDRASLISSYEKAQDDLKLAQAAALDRNQLYEENLALKEHMGRIAQPDAVMAAVIVRPPETPYDTLLIDVGKASDISLGDRVAAEGTLLIGKVTEVFEHSSRVTLFSSSGQSYDGFLRGVVPVKVEGQGGGSLKMQIPYDAKVIEGDPVTLPGIESNTASVVEHVEPGQGDSAVTAYLRLPVSIFELKQVDVWRNGN